MTAAKTFGRYRVTKTLGAGAMGEVYLATDELLGREVAIKTLKGASGLAARFIDERFRNEARAIAQLTDPGVVQVFDIDLAAEPPFLVMERVAGPALSERLAAGPLPANEIVPLGIQIARALAAAHAANVIHRDVKPSNILGAGPGTWKLADFGVAHVPDSSLTMTGQFVGSPAYAAPEALLKGISTAAGDVYGLGATLYEAASGTWPRLEAKGALLAPVPPLRERAPHVPPHIADAIDRAVALEMAQRPTAAALADLLAGAMSHAMSHPAPIAMPHATPTAMPRAVSHAAPTAISHAANVGTRGPLRWKPWAVAGAIVLAIVIGVAVRGGKPSSSSAAPGSSPIVPGVPASSPDRIDVGVPQGMDRKMANDWQKLVEALQQNDFPKARDRLDEWEHKYGEVTESASLRSQLDRLPRELFERSGGRDDDD
jgi:eukaryotic-like serine/threonine-protein kinase